ncbi:nucleotidyltransferase domain-containing protein [Oceanirhabdus sp. W0125-5]|uniref:nucleotidyltransferase domain-containing protein n=1 Tax=Oceanirhabdus sp. W0125-5 TaxID=2999116 RepID=UPI0022F2D642|nr:hypothetical protein [Oceanirhabdus sp. W0125-5]WBW96467.1 hypothetical protein OW730_22645 [Oceanirhabdus sp. W0125-5]
MNNGTNYINLEDISIRNQGYLEIMKDIYEISNECEIKSYIWGGYVIDILKGSLIREHSDLDVFTENMLEKLDKLKCLYESRGYEIEYFEDINMLEIRKGELHASFNCLDIDGEIAKWRHIGREGTVYFPYKWLDSNPREFYNVKVYTSGFKFEYAIKTKVQMLTPIWKPREKDKVSIKYLQEILHKENVSPDEIYKWIWSYNPYWYKKGYDEFFRPTIAYPLSSK